MPTRSLPNGTEIAEPVGTDGESELAVQNGTAYDAYVLVVGDGIFRQKYVAKSSTVTLDRIGRCECRVLFASGTDWDGTQFTRNRSFKKFDDVFRFYVTETTAFGHSVTLNPVKDGNTHASAIDEAEFQAALKGRR